MSLKITKFSNHPTKAAALASIKSSPVKKLSMKENEHKSRLKQSERHLSNDFVNMWGIVLSCCHLVSRFSTTNTLDTKKYIFIRIYVQQKNFWKEAYLQLTEFGLSVPTPMLANFCVLDTTCSCMFDLNMHSELVTEMQSLKWEQNGAEMQLHVFRARSTGHNQ